MNVSTEQKCVGNGQIDDRKEMEALIQGALRAQAMAEKKRANTEVEESRVAKVARTENNDIGVSPQKKPSSAHAAAAQTSTTTNKPSAKRTSPKPRGARRKQQEDHQYPVPPTTVVVIKKPRTVQNHSYRDFSKVPAELGYVHPRDISAMTFSQKVHEILSTETYAPYIGWCTHGRAFKISIPKVFEEQICVKYFGHSRYSSFLRELNNFGFKHITKGPDRNCYYHECFLRGLPHLCIYMPQPKNARRLIPDPENEPDFYKLNETYPLSSNPVETPPPGGEEERQEVAAVVAPSLASAAKVPAAAVAAAPILGSLQTQRALQSLNSALCGGLAVRRQPTAGSLLGLGPPAAAAALPAPRLPAGITNLSNALSSASVADLIQNRQQLLQQAAALESQAAKIEQETALIAAALRLRRGARRNGANSFFGGLQF